MSREHGYIIIDDELNVTAYRLVDPVAAISLTGGGGGGGGSPSGAAGGVLDGTYPNPGFAADMATQAELDAAIAGFTAGEGVTGILDVERDYGGNPNGSFDNTAAIQQAIDDGEAMVADGSGAPIVYLAPGAWGVTDTIVWKTPQIVGSFPNIGTRIIWNGADGGTVVEKPSSQESGGTAFGRLANINFRPGTGRPNTHIDTTALGGPDKFFFIERCQFLGCLSDSILTNGWVNGHWTDLRWDGIGGYAIHFTLPFGANLSSFVLDRFTYDHTLGAPFTHGPGFIYIDDTQHSSDMGVMRISNGRVEVNTNWIAPNALVVIHHPDTGSANSTLGLHLSDMTFTGFTASPPSILYRDTADTTHSDSIQMTNVRTGGVGKVGAVCGGTWPASLDLPPVQSHYGHLSFPAEPTFSTLSGQQYDVMMAKGKVTDSLKLKDKEGALIATDFVGTLEDGALAGVDTTNRRLYVQANGGLCYVDLITPIGLPIQKDYSTLGSQTATTVLSGLLGSTIAAGTTAILVAFSSANKTLSSVSDAVGNTWTVDYSFGDGTRVANFASALVTTTIQNLTEITLTWSAATSATCTSWIFEVPGLATSPFDKSAGAGAGSGTSVDSGATATLSQANEVAFCMSRIGGSFVWTHGSGWSDVATPDSGEGTSCEYRITAATTALNGTGTWSSSAAWISAVATYKGLETSL